MSKRNNVAYIKPADPKFLQQLKAQIGLKSGPNIDSKVCWSSQAMGRSIAFGWDLICRTILININFNKTASTIGQW